MRSALVGPRLVDLEVRVDLDDERLLPDDRDGFELEREFCELPQWRGKGVGALPLRVLDLDDVRLGDAGILSTILMSKNVTRSGNCFTKPASSLPLQMVTCFAQDPPVLTRAACLSN